MTTPVMGDDIVQATVKWLSGFPDVIAVLGRYPYQNAPLLFQHTWWVDMEQTGSTGVVVTDAGGWATPNQHNTARFHRVGIEVRCDPVRDTDRNFLAPGETRRRVQAAYRVIDSHMHRPAGEDALWGDLRVLSSLRLAEPQTAPVAEGDGGVRLLVFYGVTEG